MVITFDSNSKLWTKDQECNMMLLQVIESHLQSLCESRGYITHMEICDELCVPFNINDYKDCQLTDVIIFDNPDHNAFTFSFLYASDGTIIIDIIHG